jgi:hypothetical protein
MFLVLHEILFAYSKYFQRRSATNRKHHLTSRTIIPSPLKTRPHVYSIHPLSNVEGLCFHSFSSIGKSTIIRCLISQRTPMVIWQKVGWTDPPHREKGVVFVVVIKHRSLRHFWRTQLGLDLVCRTSPLANCCKNICLPRRPMYTYRHETGKRHAEITSISLIWVLLSLGLILDSARTRR